jgi:5-hydroxyisourate hydrolase
MSAGLTTHVLDTSREGPAAGVEVTLQRLDSAGKAETIDRGTTNDDGRLDEALLTAEEMETGTYQLLFDAGAYYREGALRIDLSGNRPSAISHQRSRGTLPRSPPIVARWVHDLPGELIE